MSANAEIIALLREIREEQKALLREIREEQKALRNDVNEALEAARILAQRREKKAARQARWRAAKGPKNAANVDATETLVASTERKEGERENSPHTPYREKEGERKEGICVSPACVRARTCESPANTSPTSAEPHGPDELLPDGEFKPIKPPTLAQVLSYAASHGNISESAAREFYRDMTEYGWRDKKGNPIRYWPYWLSRWNKFAPVWNKLRDPDRIPDARKGNQPFVGRRPDNWIGGELKEEDCVLG